MPARGATPIVLIERPASPDAAFLMDRFVWTECDGWVDLATNRGVTLVERVSGPTRGAPRRAQAPAGANLAATEWLERCARRVNCWHSHLAGLIDYAMVSAGRRLEAWSRQDGQSCSFSFHDLSFRHGDVRHMVRADQRAGRAIAFDLVHRPALEAMGEILDANRAGPIGVSLHAEPRAGLTTFLAAVAREARRCGVIPVCPAVLKRAELWRVLRERTVVLLVDDGGGADTTSVGAAIACAVRRAGAVSAILARRPPTARTGQLDIGPLSVTTLAASTRLFPPVPESKLLALVRESEGLPGRLADRWLAPVRRRVGRGNPSWLPPRAQAASRVAESAAPWGVRARLVAGPVTLVVHATSVPGSTRDGPLRARLDAGWRALAAARVADAVRHFDVVIDGDRDVTDGERSVAMWGLGLCALEQVRLVESERWLRAAHCLFTQGLFTQGLFTQGLTQSDPDAAHLARGLMPGLIHGLVRCLLWQGRVAEASVLLGGVSATESWEHERLRARLGLRLGRIGSALGSLASAKRLCGPDPAGRAAVCRDYARFLCHAGDRAGAVAHLRDAIAAARQIPIDVRRRSRWLRLRVVWLEMHASAGVTPRLTRARLQRVTRRLLAADVPLLVRLRASRALEAFGWRRTRDVNAFVERWGEQPLSPVLPGETAMMSDLQAVLEICRDADEPYPALERVCHCVRDRLQAASVAVHAPATRGRLVLAGSSRLATAPLASRLLDSGVAAPVAPADAGIEAGAPVTYAGRTIGAVVCRWAVGAPVDATDAETLLVTAAAALAPHVQGVLDRDRHASERTDDALGFLGASPAIAALRERVRRAALAPFHVLVEGESGSGKEVVARALHASGPRRRRRFCALNCAALTDELIEAELFGHSRGAFTGAVGERPGLFEDADGGTLFLDEVGELSPRAQAKLLRVIQDGEVRRVGENVARRVDARLIAATNRQLRDEAAVGRFRADLLYRLDVIRIVVPPLRERPEDIVLLTRAFWRDASERVGSRATLHPNTVAALARYHWPGNVRELQNVVMALAVNAPPRGTVPASRLPAAIVAQGDAQAALTLDAARRSFEERFVRAALARAGNRPCRAARELGLTRQGLRKLLVRLRIEIAAHEMAAPGIDVPETGVNASSDRQA